MKIGRYNQSTLLIDTKGVRILIDPSNIGYTEETLNEWTNIDAILITHKHPDHCCIEAIETIVKRDGAKIFTTSEVANKFGFVCEIVSEGQGFRFKNVVIEVTHAVHGYLTGMREGDREILENVGYIIDDGDTRLYTTSDTINFYNEYKCDVLCMPFNGNGITIGIVEGMDFVKAINPKLLLPIHMQHPNPIMNPNIDELRNMLDEAEINYAILEIGETIDFQ